MREFTKSMTSYTWAMSLFGLQQMVNIFNPNKSTQAFSHVTKATQDQFGEALQATFRAGDNLTRGLVDMTFGVLTLGMFDRGGTRAIGDAARQSGEALRQGGRAVSQTMETLGQTAQSATSAVAGAARRQSGWGPVTTESTDRQTTRK